MPKTEGYWILHEGPIGVLGDAGLQETRRYADLLKEGGAQDLQAETGGWLGITDKYWAAALIPDQKTPYRGEVHAAPRAAKGLVPGRLPARPRRRPRRRQGSPTTSNLFAGAKQTSA